jgi:uncharacterized cupin superfamily protein
MVGIVMSKKIASSTVEKRVGTSYPAPYDSPCKRRERQRLGEVAGLMQFGVNLLRLPPGEWSSQRHWHTHEEEFVFVVSGEVMLVTDDGEEMLRAGDTAGFRANDPNGHHLQNRSQQEVVLLEIGSRRDEDSVFYSDIDMQALVGGDFTRRDGSAF